MSVLRIRGLRHDAASTDAINLDSSGNVGVGTGSPSGFRLNVSGGRSNFNSADDYAVRIGKNGTYGGYIGSNAADVMNFYDSSGNEGFRLNNQTLQLNNGYGSIATFYGCRAWVNFNGTGTVAIRGSGNVSSITDHASGQYTTNFINAMPDTNYCVQATGDHNPGAYIVGGAGIRRGSVATTSVRTDFISDGNQLTDMEIICVSIFR